MLTATSDSYMFTATTAVGLYVTNQPTHIIGSTGTAELYTQQYYIISWELMGRTKTNIKTPATHFMYANASIAHAQGRKVPNLQFDKHLINFDPGCLTG